MLLQSWRLILGILRYFLDIFQLTYADVTVFSVLDQLSRLDSDLKEIIEDFEDVKRHMTDVSRNPNVAKYLSNRNKRDNLAEKYIVKRRNKHVWEELRSETQSVAPSTILEE